MENTLVVKKVDPKEFGLEEQKASEIESAFTTSIIERNALLSVFSEIIKKDITPEVERQAKALRLKLVKNRTGIVEIHRVKKAYSLAYGRFVDAWKNKEILQNEQAEATLLEIETFSERKEAERIEKLKMERMAILSPFCENASIYPVSQMSQESFDELVYGFQLAKKQKEDELLRIENERVEAKKKEVERLEKLRIEKELEDKKIREENEKLRIEKEKAEIQLKEQQRISDEKAKKIREENEKLAKIEREKNEAIQAKKDVELKKIREENEKLAKEKQDEINRLAEIERKKRIEAEQLAKSSDKIKVKTWINSFSISVIEKSNLSIESKSITSDIESKFEAFKIWAINQIEKL